MSKSPLFCSMLHYLFEVVAIGFEVFQNVVFYVELLFVLLPILISSRFQTVLREMQTIKEIENSYLTHMFL